MENSDDKTYKITKNCKELSLLRSILNGVNTSRKHMVGGHDNKDAHIVTLSSSWRLDQKKESLVSIDRVGRDLVPENRKPLGPTMN